LSAVKLDRSAAAASAGGLDALTKLLQNMPADTGMAFVLIQHLDPVHKSELSTLLSTSTNMPVQQVIDGMRVVANQVYVIPPNTMLHFSEQGREPALALEGALGRPV